MIKVRLFALGLIVVSTGLTYYNWYQLNTEGRYSLKIATFAPLGVVGGIFILLFPTKMGKPISGLDKVIVMAVFVIGLLAGLVNWYLMDPSYFGR